MPTITIAKRFCGPPNSANGGYVCGLLAKAMGGSAEVTLRAPPPLLRALDIEQAADGRTELRQGASLLATGRLARLDTEEVPTASFSEAEEASRRSPYDEATHNLPSCFVCGPARAIGDGLRIFVGPLASRRNREIETLAATWVPAPDLSGDDGRIAAEFVWAALDCPTGFAALAAAGTGLQGNEPILLGRMAARLDSRPKPGEQCVIVAWPTGRDGRKLFASSALFGSEGELVAVAQATWLLVDRAVQLGQR
jgi:hypothetical protein